MKNGAKRSLNKALNYVTGAALIVSLLVALSGCADNIKDSLVKPLTDGDAWKDEVTGCEYFLVRQTLTPRIDESGMKVKGCTGE